MQHKYWRPVGHQVLQPAKDGKLGQYVWKVVDSCRRKNVKSSDHQQLFYDVSTFTVPHVVGNHDGIIG